MKRVFKNVKGERIDPISHTLEILNKYPNVGIHVGCDSQTYGDITKYAIVIAYKYGTRGVHYIVSKHKDKYVKDDWLRLWKEAECTIEVAKWLKDNLNVNIEVDFDYNENPTYLSNKLIGSAKGWASSLGFKVNVKPHHNRIAVYAADYECR